MTADLRVQTPADVIRIAGEANLMLGHENAGALSGERGFVPHAPALRLPASHALWDEVAGELPSLYASLGLRRRLESLPRLDISTLPDHALQRAATVLGILVHAYHRVEPGRETPTPDSVLLPWRGVCARLGRNTPFLSYVDLIVANWRYLDPAGPVAVENLRLLVPTVGVDEEQFFYLTQLEMLARGTPLVAAAARAGAAVSRDDAGAAADELELMTSTIVDVTTKGLPKIDPRRGTRFHVDPVVWAKTVAPLAVPLVKGGLGPSGTASPMFHLIDAVIGRTGYHSFIGEEAAKLRQNYPPHWRAFIEAVASSGISRYAENAGHPALDRALADLRRRYSGEGGLLWRHRLKVAGYLDTSFRVGRDVTISGFPAAIKVGEELNASRAERPGAPSLPDPSPQSVTGPRITHSELLRHHRFADRQWIGVHGRVLDVTDFVRRHPGGIAPLAAHLGTDASAAYEHVGHHRQRGILRMAETMVIGELVSPEPSSWLHWAVTLTQQANVFATDLTIRESRTSLASSTGELTPYTLQFAIEAHERFIERTLPHIASLVAGGHLSVAEGELYAALESEDLSSVEALWRRAVERDFALLDSVREFVRLGVAAAETGGKLPAVRDQVARAVRDYVGDR